MADYSRKDVDGFVYKLVEPIGVLSARTIQGELWKLEANWISWNHKPAKIDIRSWDSKHEYMSKGVTLTRAEADKLFELLR